jgi:preprotein translocase subunit SecG
MSGIASVVLIVHVLVALAMIGVILLQRSEGGALGMGGGAGSFLSARSAGNVLTRTTTILVAVFFITSMALTVLGRHSAPKTLDLTTPAPTTGTSVPQPVAPQPAAPSSTTNQLPALPGFPSTAAPPAGSAPASNPPAAPEPAPEGPAPAKPGTP